MTDDHVTEMTVQEMDALITRMESVLADGLSPEPEDIQLILQILRQFATMQTKLEGSAYLKERYLKLMGLVSSSETQGALLNRGASPSKKPRNKKRRPADKAPAPTICHHAIQDLEKGQVCPECEQGRLYKYEPASFIRLVGQPPLRAKSTSWNSCVATCAAISLPHRCRTRWPKTDPVRRNTPILRGP